MEIVIIILLILLNGIFAMSEIALISARRSNLELRARQGNAGARRALRIIEDPDKFLSTIQIGITLIGILTGIYSGDALAAKFGRELALLGIPLRTATIAAQVTIVVIVTYLTLIFGELVPKRIGMNTAEKIACAVARPMPRLAPVISAIFSISFPPGDMRLLYRSKERNTSHCSLSVSYSPVSFSPNSRAVSATTASYPVSAANEENCAARSRRGMSGCTSETWCGRVMISS